MEFRKLRIGPVVPSWMRASKNPVIMTPGVIDLNGNKSKL